MGPALRSHPVHAKVQDPNRCVTVLGLLEEQSKLRDISHHIDLHTLVLGSRDPLVFDLPPLLQQHPALRKEMQHVHSLGRAAKEPEGHLT
jgi:hypothetical protein